MKKNSIFVIQKHDATRLHYDLRLEMNGVLKSWAIPKTIPIEKGVKRLAIQTEDHDIEYADFEGVSIGENKRTSSVEIWDKGTFEIETKKENEMVIDLNGTKLNGRYCLIRFKGQEKNWLFFKC